jgi:hypothetical protein
MQLTLMQGMGVILDLHWSDKGNMQGDCAQQTMADSNSVLFWQQVTKKINFRTNFLARSKIQKRSLDIV